MSAKFDTRITPARPDIAATSLKGKVAAERFVEGHLTQVARGVVDLRSGPSQDAGLHTQLLFGEQFTVYEDRDGWLWGQTTLDGYVGYARREDFDTPRSPTHRVVSLATPLLNAPDVKKGARDMLPMNARISVTDSGCGACNFVASTVGAAAGVMRF